MKKVMFVLWAVMAAHFSEAQEKKQYEVKNFKGLVNITGSTRGLVIEGYSGNSVILEAEGGESKLPEKAAGLRMVTAGGLDNTGISATVEEETVKMITSINDKGEEKTEDVRVLNIHIPNASKLFKNYVIKVPHGLTTRFRSGDDDYWGGRGSLEIKSFVGELDVNCSGCNLNISGFSGNIIASNSSYGGTTRIEFEKLAQDKITSINTEGELEIILPSTTKANLRMSTSRGNIFTDFDLKKATAEAAKDPLSPVVVVGTAASPARVRSSGQGTYTVEGGSISVDMESSQSATTQALASVKAARRGKGRYDYTLNDGGVYLSVISRGGNIYLKKK